MPRKRTTDSVTSAPEEQPAPTQPKTEATKPDDSSEQDNTSAANTPIGSAATSPSPPSSTPSSPSPPESEVQLQPATFAREGRTMVCTVCGTEARQNLDHQLFCPNAHNHPPLTSEAPKS